MASLTAAAGSLRRNFGMALVSRRRSLLESYDPLPELPESRSLLEPEEPPPGLLAPAPRPPLPRFAQAMLDLANERALGRTRSLLASDDPPVMKPDFNLLTGEMSPAYRALVREARQRADQLRAEQDRLRAEAETGSETSDERADRSETRTEPSKFRPVGRFGAAVPKDLGLLHDAADPADAEGSSAHSGETELPAGDGTRPPPAIRSEVFKGKTWWRDFNAALEKTPFMGEMEKFAISEIYGVEGGNGVDQKSRASSGLLPSTLDSLKRDGLVPGVAANARPEDLTMAQRAVALQAYLDREFRTVEPFFGRHGSAGVLNSLDNPYAAAALADTLVLHGSRDRAEAIQKAINDVSPGRAVVDGTMGSRTWQAYRDIANDPAKLGPLLEALANRRLPLAKDPGEKTRINYYRYSNRP